MDPGPAYKRRRPATACTQCRRRKVRCDSASPCGPCRKSSNPRCIYHNSTAALNESSHQIVQADISLLGSTPSKFNQHTFQDNHLQDWDVYTLDTTTAELPTKLLDDIGIELNTYFGLHDSHGSAASTGSPNGSSFSGESNTQASSVAFSEAMGTGLGSMPVHGGDFPSWASTSGSDLDAEVKNSIEDTTSERENHWQDSVVKCENLRFLMHGIGGYHNDDPQHDHLKPLMEKFTKLERHSQPKLPTLNLALGWPATASIGLPAYEPRKLLPPQATCDMLLDAYTNTFESVLRILHVPTFMSEYRRFWATPPLPRSVDAEEPFLCKLMIILALGSYVCPGLDNTGNSIPGTMRNNVSIREQASGWLSHVKQWLAKRMMAGSRADLEMAQIVCLLALARYTDSGNTAPAGSLLLGDHDLTRLAIQMGLHRDPLTCNASMSATEVEMRRRLWATMLELSLQFCLDEGLPAPISPESYDCEPPSNIADEDMSSASADAMPTLRDSLMKNNLTRSTPLALLAQTQRLRLRILHLVNSPGATKSYEDSHGLAAELRAAYCDNLRVIHTMKMKLKDFQTKVLNVFTWPFVLAPHSTFADCTKSNPTYYYSRKMRMEVSGLLLSRYHPLGDQIGLDPSIMQAVASTDSISLTIPRGDATTAALAMLGIHGQGSLARLLRRTALTLCFDLISELEENVFPTVAGASWRHLRDVVRCAMTVLEYRVRMSRGANSARDFLVGSCADAYIGAMLQGYGPHETAKAIGEAAQRVLILCCEMMEQRQR